MAKHPGAHGSQRTWRPHKRREGIGPATGSQGSVDPAPDKTHTASPAVSGTGSTAVPSSPKRRHPKPADGAMSSAPPAPDASKHPKRQAEARAAKRQESVSGSDSSCGDPAESSRRPGTGTSLLCAPPAQNAASKRGHGIADAQYGTRPYFMRRLGALELERATWVAHWREIAEYMAPRRQRQFWYDRNRGVKRNEKIINPTATLALRTLASGMHSGLTSPARPWYRLAAPFPELNEVPAVRSWLHYVEEAMRSVHARSNLYNVLPQIYGDLGAFGTGCMWIDEDPVEVIRCYVFPINSYALGIGANQRIDSLYRRVSMSVAAVVDEFGYEACSPRVKDLYDKGHLDTWILICHACEPNRQHDPGNALSKKYLSVWFELEEGSADPTKFLKRSGYDSFPASAPRWNVNGEDVYGFSPGMDALGDVRALQQLERRKMATADKIVNPPFVAPAALRNQRVSLMAGDVSYLDAQTPQGARFEPAIVLPPAAMTVEEESIREHEGRIKETFFATLWMLISSDERSTPATAEEIRAKQDEKMLQLGPVLERLHDELLDQIVDRTFEIMLKRNMIPPPPQELIDAANAGDDQIRVEYMSVLAQAQKMVGTAAIDRQVAFVGNLAQLNPEALDLLDTDKVVREYQTMLGTNPETIRGEDVVAKMREERAMAQKAAQDAEIAAKQAQAANSASGAVRNLATSPLNDENGPSALTGLLGTLGPAAVSGAGEPNGGIGA